MDMKRFTELMVKTVEAAMPNDVKEYATIEIREVVKFNDKKLHAIMLTDPERTVMPSIYLEDLYERYEEGELMSDLAKYVIEINTMPMPCEIQNVSLDFDEIKDRLTFKLAEISSNSERLNDLIFKNIGNGFALIPYIVFKRDESGGFMSAVTKDIAKDFNYDIEETFAMAEKNTLENDEPIMCDILIGITNGINSENNLLKHDYGVLDNSMYILSNESGMNGAVSLYIGETQSQISKVLGENYYILPSSIHELMIVPESKSPGIKELRNMVSEVNLSDAVDGNDFLSNRVLFYDKDTGELTEPEYPF